MNVVEFYDQHKDECTVEVFKDYTRKPKKLKYEYTIRYIDKNDNVFFISKVVGSELYDLEIKGDSVVRARYGDFNKLYDTIQNYGKPKDDIFDFSKCLTSIQNLYEESIVMKMHKEILELCKDDPEDLNTYIRLLKNLVNRVEQDYKKLTEE